MVEHPTGATSAQHSEISLQACKAAMLVDLVDSPEPLVVSPQDPQDFCNYAVINNDTLPLWCSHCTTYRICGPSIWYSCVDCGLIVCKTCHQKGATGFCLKTLGPHDLKTVTASSFISKPDSQLPESHSDDESTLSSSCPSPVVHAGISCDACLNNNIHGVRYKCQSCRDYDLCSSCITTGSAEKHDPLHNFYEMLKPDRIHKLVSGEQLRGFPIAPLVVHTAYCDLCSLRITGDRYKCASCPDFDTCSSCFTVTETQHPNHSFFKITKPGDFIERLVGQGPTHYATCNACNKTIYGTRFKCMHPDCSDFDLCRNCEELPIAVHPVNHPMLKMKTRDAGAEYF